MLDQIWAVAAQIRNEVLVGITAEERNTLMALLERVHENLLNLKPIAGSSPPAAPPAVPTVKASASLNRKSPTR
jgi:hypothetical protein